MRVRQSDPGPSTFGLPRAPGPLLVFRPPDGLPGEPLTAVCAWSCGIPDPA